ncbi:MAG: phosphonate ABC transporter, permease protein PhnE [Dehalococcoidia bacterium]
MTRQQMVFRAVTLALAALFILSLSDLGLLDLERIQHGTRNLGTFLREMFPPRREVLGELSRALVETLQIAFVGTVIGFLIGLPLAVLAVRGLVPLWIAEPIKLVLAVVRTIPSILWALVFVIAVGLGPAAGALGVALYTAGFLGKNLYELFEGVDVEVMEAVRGVGASRLELARWALLPEASNGVVSQLLFMFEYNVRASSILGFVGAGGIGFYLNGYMELLDYRSLLTAILLTLGAVLVIDRASSALRRTLR